MNESTQLVGKNLVISQKMKYDAMVLTNAVIPSQKNFLVKHMFSQTPVLGSKFCDSLISTLLVCSKKQGIIPNVNEPTPQNLQAL